MKNKTALRRNSLHQTVTIDPLPKSIVLYSRDMDFCVSLSLLFQDRYKIITITDPDLLLTTVKAFQPAIVIADTFPTERMQCRFRVMKNDSPLLRIMIFYAPQVHGDQRQHDAIRRSVDAAFSKPIDIEEVSRQIGQFMTEDR